MNTLKNEIMNRLKDLFPNDFLELERDWDFDRISIFYTFLLDYNEEGGFFSKSETPNILDRHIIESIYHIHKLKSYVTISRETKIADVGTGPGLPGFLFCCLNEPPLLSLIDSQKRKLGILQKFSTTFKLSQTPAFIFDRVEGMHKKFDLVIMRSSIPYPWSIELVSRIVKNGGYFTPFLAKHSYNSEIEKSIFARFGFELSSEINIPELNFLGERHIKVLIKRLTAKDALPRTWTAIQKEIRAENGKSNIDQ